MMKMKKNIGLVMLGVLVTVLAPVQAAGNSDTYAKALKSHPSLRAHWQFDGDLSVSKGKANAKSGGAVSYADGVLGKALKVDAASPVSLPKADWLMGKKGSRVTLELFFKVVSAPTGKQDVVLIGQTTGQKVRYLAGVKNDLSALLYRGGQNPSVLTTINLPTDQPVEVGRWYHLAITSYDLDLRAYIDGYECALTGGAFEFTRNGPKNSIMTFGTTPFKGLATGAVLLDEVAVYGEGLTQAQIQEHIKAAGLEKQLAATGEIVAKVAAERDAVRERKLATMLKDPALTAKGEPRIYEGENLSAIAFQVGGIGSGSIQFNGKAEPAIWQIAKNFEEKRVANSFLAVRAQTKGGQPVVRALQTSAVGPFAAMPSLKFEGEYPFANYRFEEPELPVEVELEVFNPLIPMDLKNSAIPCAIYTVTAKNTSTSPVTVDVLAAQRNALGYEAKKGNAFGQNLNKVVRKGEATMLHMMKQASGADMVLMTLANGASGVAAFDSPESLKNSFAKAGAFQGLETAGPSAKGKTLDGALSAPLELAPGETKSVTYALTWYFKSPKHGSGKRSKAMEGEPASGPWSHAGQKYTTWWPSAMGIADYLTENLDGLTARTRLYHDTLYASDLPRWLLDRFSSPLAVLRSQTCWWAADDYFGAWEGSRQNMGSCGGNCTHVWQYAQGHARLFPELGRLMRHQDFAQQKPTGLFPNRHGGGEAAADGFFGTILNIYREHLCSADDEWVKAKWPKVKKAMEFGMEHWDPNHDGFLQNRQHNTLDGKMWGCSSWIGSIYLSALEAAARIADIAGDSKTASEYRKIRASGQKMQNERLWNGEYYIQEVGVQREQDYLDGCHIDQLLGDWWAVQVGIDPSFPQDRSRTAMESLFKYNYLADSHGHSLKPRQYYETADGGIKMITWPKNPQPIPGMKYGDEVMTGFEYAAAATMMQNGLQDEGLVIFKTIYDRYDGRLRSEGVTDLGVAAWGYSGNPFGDDECGKYYGRSLSSWSALLVLQGFIYDGPAGRIGFRPIWQPENHASFFTGAEGYGLFFQTLEENKLNASIDLKDGQLRLTEIVLAASNAESAQLTLAGKPVASSFSTKDGDVILKLQKPLTLQAGQQLDIQVQ
ncbi:GH116 family glycosyl hydrolase [Pontiellaceae bacterium B12227]|nr:GH116 family glycosyl hydrolase [Pontiellaceae bacterium B12227]